jgi:hypothetical protein
LRVRQLAIIRSLTRLLSTLRFEQDDMAAASSSSTTTTAAVGQSDFVHWTEIEAFHSLMRKRMDAHEKRSQNQPTSPIAAEHDQALLQPQVSYGSKVKFHGSNCGVIVQKDKVLPQSRNQVITDIKSGFGKLVENTKAYWLSLAEFEGLDKFVVFGEHCGPEVQKTGTALNKLAHDIYLVFGIDIGGERLVVEPAEIERFLTKNGTVPMPENVFVIPWFDTVELDFTNVEECEAKLNAIDEQVNAIDKEDPWVKATFGVTGTGEGLVLYPLVQSHRDTATDSLRWLNRRVFSDMAFKCKGVNFRVVTSTKSATMLPEKAGTPQEFAAMVCAEPRMRQGVDKIGGFQRVMDSKKTNEFLKWVLADVKKECQGELKQSNMKWNDVSEAVRTTAYNWYSRQLGLFLVPLFKQE